VSEPIREKNFYDETDGHLMAALYSVEVPADLRSRLERSLQVAQREQELLESSSLASSLAEQVPKVRRADIALWNRRNAIAATLAVGVGGIVLGFRQLSQPLTQAHLVARTQDLLDQVQRTQWRTLTEADAVAIKRSLQDVGFLRQVRSVSLVGVSQLQPPRNIHSATAYDFGSQLVLLDLIIERGVQRISQSLSELPWSRSDTVAFAMSSEQRTLVFAGPASIRDHILPAQTT